MNLLFGSLKLEHDTLADAVATLDPTNKFLVKAIPRLSTLYNIFEEKDEMESIGALAKAAASEDPETHTKLTKFFVVVFGKVARPRTKILCLWLSATYAERTADLEESMRKITTACHKLKQSTSIVAILHTVLAVSNFLNHGSARGGVKGVKVSALLKLKQTKTTASDPHQHLLHFVVRHAKVDTTALRDELPQADLQQAYLTTPRAEIKRELGLLRTERNTTQAEAKAIAKDGDAATAKIADALLRAVTDRLEDLEKRVKAMDEAVDGVLSHFGEAPTVDCESWIKDLETFCSQYEHEHKLVVEKDARDAKRRELDAKADERNKIVQDLMGNKSKSKSRLPSLDHAKLEAAPPPKASGRDLRSLNARGASFYNADVLVRLRGACAFEDKDDDTFTDDGSDWDD